MRIGQGGANFHAFVGRRHEEEARPGSIERLARALDPRPIGIGLDHGSRERAGTDLVQGLPVAGECPQIDAQLPAKARGQRHAYSMRSGR